MKFLSFQGPKGDKGDGGAEGPPGKIPSATLDKIYIFITPCISGPQGEKGPRGKRGKRVSKYI